MSKGEHSCQNCSKNDPIVKLNGTVIALVEQLTYMNAYLGLLVDELLEARKMNMSVLAGRVTPNSQMPQWKHIDEDLL